MDWTWNHDDDLLKTWTLKRMIVKAGKQNLIFVLDVPIPATWQILHSTLCLTVVDQRVYEGKMYEDQAAIADFI
jgi:hypothetical protein